MTPSDDHDEPERTQPLDPEAAERLELPKTEKLDDALAEFGLPKTERLEELVDDALEHVGLPKTEKLEEIVGDAIERIGHTVRLPDPLEAWDDAKRGADWIDRQLSPLADQLDSFRDQLEAYRDQTERMPQEDDDGWGPVAWFAFVAFLAWAAGQEFTVEFEVDDALWTFDEGDDDKDANFEVWNKTLFIPPGSFAARLGDPMMHGDSIAPGIGSPNVFIGGKPALRVCDGHVCTKVTPIPHVGTGFTSTYGKVLINGFAGLRVGDFVNEGIFGLNPIVGGCPSVTVGPKAPPVVCWLPSGGGAPEPPPSLLPFRWTKGELGHFKGKVVLGADIEGPFGRIDGTVTAARLWAEDTTTHDIPVGDIDGDGRDEALRLTTKSKTERVLGVSEVELEVRPYPWRVSGAEAKPKDPKPEPPEIEVDSEIVELS